MTLLLWIGVGLLGGVGAVVRVALTQALGRGRRGTLVVNLAGTLALGLVVGAGLEGDALLLAGGGLLGALTTFSAWMADAAGGRSVLGLAVPLVLGLGAAAAGHMIGAAV